MLSPALTALERRWHDEIPLSAAMGLKIVDGDDGALSLHAPLAPNRNVHGTGFACGRGRCAGVDRGSAYYGFARRSVDSDTP